MNFSLRDIGKKIGDVLGGVERQVNPFDGGATYSNPRPAPQAPQPAPTPSPQQMGPVQGRPLQTPFNQPASMASFGNPSPNPFQPTQSITQKPVQPWIPKKPQTPVPPADGDVAGLRQALNNINQYAPDDRIRILQRSGQAKLLPSNVVAAEVKNSLTPNTPYRAPSKLSVLGNAIADVGTGGLADLARTEGTNLAAGDLFDKAASGQMELGDVKNVLNQSYGSSGYNLDEPLSKAIRTGAGQAMTGAVAIASLGTGAGKALEAANAAEAASVASRAADAAKIGAAYGVPQGVAQTLQEDHPTVTSAAKNIASGFAQNAALPFAMGEVGNLANRAAWSSGLPDREAVRQVFGDHAANEIDQAGNNLRSAYEDLDTAHQTKNPQLIKAATENAVQAHQSWLDTNQKWHTDVPVTPAERPQNATQGGFIMGPQASPIARKLGIKFKDPKTGRILWEGDDSGMKFHDDYDGMQHLESGDSLPLSDMIQHDKLYEAYPDLAMLPTRFDPTLGENTAGQYNGREMLLNPDHVTDEAGVLDTILHEFTHDTQDREGLPHGGDQDTGRFAKMEADAKVEDAKKNPVVQDFLSKTRQVIAAAKERGASPQELNTALRRLEHTGGPEVQELLNVAKRAKSLKDLTPSELYRRLHGEAMAFNAESRRTMTMDERRATPFNDTYKDAQGKPLAPEQLLTEHEDAKARAESAFLADDSSYKQVDAPTHRAYGREIAMTPENGYIAHDTADGGQVYQKVAKHGSNAKGTQLENTWYAKDGTKLTQAQAEAMKEGRMASSKPKVTAKTPDNMGPDAYSSVFGVSPEQAQSEMVDPAHGIYTNPLTGDAPRAAKPAVYQKIKLSKVELQAGRALGMTKKEIEAAKDSGDLFKAFQRMKSRMKPEDLAHLTPGDQMAIEQAMRPNIPLSDPGLNLAKNPTDTSYRFVKAGDYGAARNLPGAVSKPVEFLTDRAMHKLFQLRQTNMAEFKNFWRMVETKQKGSAEFEAAKQAWRELSNKAHANSVPYKNTNYFKDYALHPWLIAHGGEELTSQGLGALGSHSLGRKYMTIAEGEENGLKLNENPLEDVAKYGYGVSRSLWREAAKAAATQADNIPGPKPRTLDLGNGHSVPVSEKGWNNLKGLAAQNPSTNRLAVGLRTLNAGLKSSTLSLSQFHTVNVGVMRAAPTLVATGHGGAALTGLKNMAMASLPRGAKHAEAVLNKATREGVVDPGTKRPISFMEAAAKIGAPYGGGNFGTEGSLLKQGLGHKFVFERQLPMMHDQVIRSVVSDLVKKGVSLDSAEARKAGVAANGTMGFINKEATNMSPTLRQAMADWMLAGQFTPSKAVTLSKVFSKGVAGKYARADVLSNAVAATALIMGAGYLVHQKTDNVRDMLLRALINPAVPTPYKDKKGNNVEVRVPMTYTSEVAHLVGMKLVRNKDGHLGVSWDPSNMPGTIAEWARSRLSPLAGDGVKVATNTDFANKPLYDPNAPAGTKAIQAGTILTEGHLPIGLQGLPETKVGKDAIGKVSGSAETILNANTSKINPVLAGAGSSLGFTPRTDQTVGAANDASHYFSALDAAKQKLNSHEAAAIELYAGNKKNPVTGQYDVMPNANDSQAKARALLDQPGALNALITMNQRLKAEGQKTDPMWDQSPDKIKAILAYQAMPPGGPDKTHWFAQNGTWYTPVSQARGDFFSSLPKGDPNKPAAPIEFPSPTSQVADMQKQYDGIKNPSDAAKFLDSHPELQDQFDKQAKYNNDMRTATGYSPLDTYPTASPAVKAAMKEYNALPDSKSAGNTDPATNKLRSQWIKAHPDLYSQMSSAMTDASVYGLQREAAQAEFADTNPSQKMLKEASNLGQYDITKNSDGTYALGGSGSGSGSGKTYVSSKSSSGSSSSRASYADAALQHINVQADGVRDKMARVKASPVTATKVTGKFRTGAKARASVKVASRPKVSFKKA